MGGIMDVAHDYRVVAGFVLRSHDVAPQQPQDLLAVLRMLPAELGNGVG